MNKSYLFFFLLIAFLGFASCGVDYSPKPRGYLRIDLPQKEYIRLDSIYPYTFEYPVYAEIRPDEFSPDKPYWINLEFPSFKGKVHLSYKPVNDNLVKYLEDSRTMVVKHIPKASAIREQLVVRPEDEVFGLKYRIEGLGAASPYQFFLTDSTNHFLRGALYFSVKPNNDSLAPVIEFIEKDIDHLIRTMQWKQLNS